MTSNKMQGGGTMSLLQETIVHLGHSICVSALHRTLHIAGIPYCLLHGVTLIQWEHSFCWPKTNGSPSTKLSAATESHLKEITSDPSTLHSLSLTFLDQIHRQLGIHACGLAVSKSDASPYWPETPIPAVRGVPAFSRGPVTVESLESFTGKPVCVVVFPQNTMRMYPTVVSKQSHHPSPGNCFVSESDI